MKAELKTKKTGEPVDRFIASLKDPAQQRDCRMLASMMERATGEKGRMWGSIVGFKDVHLRYASGRELDWFALGFAPRKGGLSLHLCCAMQDPKVRALLPRLGPHSHGVGCLYLKSLDGIDSAALRQLLSLAAKAKLPTNDGSSGRPARSATRSSASPASSGPSRSSKSPAKRASARVRSPTPRAAARGRRDRPRRSR